MVIDALKQHYLGYLDCLNHQRWADLGDYVDASVEHNGRPLGLAGYQAMLEADFAAIPDLQFNAILLIAEPPRIAARLAFDCSPRGEFLGLAVNGRRVSFTENVFYTFDGPRIVSVWSVLDKRAIEAQL